MMLKDKLLRMGACPSAVDWVGDRDLSTAWSECTNPQWMLWFAGRIIDRKILVRVACAIAREALQYVPAGEARPRLAIEAAEGWAEGRVKIEVVDKAAYEAYAAANAAANAAAYAAYVADAADTANAAYKAAHVAADAAEAAYKAAHAAANAAEEAAHATAKQKQCEIIRSMIPLILLGGEYAVDPINYTAGYRYWFESEWNMVKKIYARTRKEAIRLLRRDVEEAILKQEEREADELACEKAAHGYPKKGGRDE